MKRFFKSIKKKVAITLLSIATVLACGAGFALTSKTVKAADNAAEQQKPPITAQYGAQVRLNPVPGEEEDDLKAILRFSFKLDNDFAAQIGNGNKMAVVIIIPYFYYTDYQSYYNGLPESEKETAWDLIEYIQNVKGKDPYGNWKYIIQTYKTQDKIARVDEFGNLLPEDDTTTESFYAIRNLVNGIRNPLLKYVGVAYTADIDKKEFEGTNRTNWVVSEPRTYAYVASATLNEELLTRSATIGWQTTLKTEVKKAGASLLGDNKYDGTYNPFLNAAYNVDIEHTDAVETGNGEPIALSNTNNNSAPPTAEMVIPKLLTDNFSLKFTSSDSTIASVDNNGKITAGKSGTAKIAVQIGEMAPKRDEDSTLKITQEVFVRTFTVTVSNNAEIVFTKNVQRVFEWVVENGQTLNRDGGKVDVASMEATLVAGADKDFTVIDDAKADITASCTDYTFTSMDESVVKVVEVDGKLKLKPVGHGTSLGRVQIKVEAKDSGGNIKAVGFANVRVDIYTILRTKKDLAQLNTKAKRSGKYILMGDIDLGGAEFETICHYNDIETMGKFYGILDGNGYSIMNFTPVNKQGVTKNDYSDAALIGNLGDGGIVQNLNVLNAKLYGRSSALVGLCDGTIQNCFVDAVIMKAEEPDVSNLNPAAPVAAKLNKSGVSFIYNTISRLTFDANFTGAKQYVGAFVGRSVGDTVIENCYAISDNTVGFDASGCTQLGTKTNTADYDGLSAFYADSTGFAAQFTNAVGQGYQRNWTFVKNGDTILPENGGGTAQKDYLPMVGTAKFGVDSAEQTAYRDIQEDTTYQIVISANRPVKYALNGSYDGISLDSETGLLTIKSTSTVDTTKDPIKVTITSDYMPGSATVTINIVNYVYTVEAENLTFDWVQDMNVGGAHTTKEPERSAAIAYTVKKGEEPYTGAALNLTFKSSNENVATVVDGKVTAVGDGKATITIGHKDHDGLILGTFTVTSDMYLGVSTTDNLDDIDETAASLKAKYRLMADIDVNGKLISIAHYSHTIDGVEIGDGIYGRGFNGVFDGNGHTISDFTPTYGSTDNAGDSALFSVISKDGVIKNLNVVGVTLKGEIQGGIAMMNYGTIENCFAEVTITTASSDADNPSGGLVAKNLGVVRNCIAYTTVTATGDLYENIGAFVGRAWSAFSYGGYTCDGSTIENCYSISPSTNVGFCEEQLADGSDAFQGTAINYGDFNTLTDFYDGAENGVDTEITAFKDTFVNAGWTFKEGFYPTYGTINSTLSVTTPASVVLARGTTEYQIAASSNLPITYELVNAPNSVSVDATGKVSFPANLAETITVNVKNMYAGKTEQIKINVVDTFAVNTTKCEIKDWLNPMGEGESTGNIMPLDFTLTWTGAANDVRALTFDVEDENVATVDENGNIVAVGHGETTINVIFSYVGVDGQLKEEVKTIPVTSTMYNGVSTVAHLGIIHDRVVEAVSAGTIHKDNYKLMNDIDVEGANLQSIGGSTWQDGTGFSGIFDGNGYAIMNFTPAQNNNPNAVNTGLFAVLNNGATVKNLNLLNVTVKSRSSALVAHCYGTIENCFVDVTIDFFEQEANNPTGGVVTKLYKGATIRNTIANVRVGSVFTKEIEAGKTTYSIGAMVGRSYGDSTMENCYAISPSALGLFEAMKPTSNNQEIEPNLGNETNCFDYNDLATFYAEGPDSNVFGGWTFAEGFYPIYGDKEHSQIIHPNVELNTADTEYQINATSNLPAWSLLYTVVDNNTGAEITVDATGKVTIAGGLTAGDSFGVKVQSIYDSLSSITITFTVKEYTFTATTTTHELNFIKGETTPSTAPSTALEYAFKKDGAECTEELTFTSSNTAVAKVNEKGVVTIAEGATDTETVTISVTHRNLEFSTKFTVKCTAYIPVRTTADFDAIDNNKAANYILMNDIDFTNYVNNGNAKNTNDDATEKTKWFLAFSSYNTAVGATTTAPFTGIFDGNGYALKNITPGNDRHYYKKDYEFSIFGVVGETGVIKNLAVYANVVHRGGVIASYLNGGTIENCYVEATIQNASEATAYVQTDQKGLGFIVQRSVGGAVSNCIAKLVFKNDDSNYAAIGGIVSQNISSASIQNCSVICEKTKTVEKGDGTQETVPVIGLFVSNTGGATVDANSAVYANMTKFTEERTAEYDTAKIWSFAGFAPTLRDGCSPVVNN